MSSRKQPPPGAMGELVLDGILERTGFMGCRPVPALPPRGDLEWTFYCVVGDAAERTDYASVQALAERVPGSAVLRVPALVAVVPDLDGYRNTPPEEFVAYELAKRAGEVN